MKPKKQPKLKKKASKKPTKPKKRPKIPVIVDQKTGEIKVSEADLIIEAVGGDTELALFFMQYIKNGRDAGKAYKFLHKNVTAGSSRVLGSRMLARVNKEMILESYGMGFGAYMKQLKEGLEATNVTYEKVKDADGNEEVEIIEVPDHRTRRHYHKALGDILKLEGVPVINVQQNNLQQNNNTIENMTNEELDTYLLR